MRAEIERDGHRNHVDGQRVVGCDGIHSATRDLVGIGFEGHDIAKPWAVFDATLEGWNEPTGANVLYLDAVPVIVTGLPRQRWRVYLRRSSEAADPVAGAAATLRRYAPAASFVDVEHPTRFHCHTKVATRFRSGRVLLAGDAAHVCSPAEGHGMNAGLQDAFNLAWKLALVHHGAADPALLDSYEARSASDQIEVSTRIIRPAADARPCSHSRRSSRPVRAISECGSVGSTTRTRRGRR